MWGWEHAVGLRSRSGRVVYPPWGVGVLLVEAAFDGHSRELYAILRGRSTAVQRTVTSSPRQAEVFGVV